MIYSHITATGATGTNGVVFAGPVRKAIVQVNAALTGTLTIYDTTGSSASANTVAIITNPTVGNLYEYWGLQNGFKVFPSASCDVTASADLSRSGI